MLVDDSGVAQTRLGKIVERVHGDTSTGHRQSFHITALGTTQGNNSLLCKSIQRERVDSLSRILKKSQLKVSMALIMQGFTF